MKTANIFCFLAHLAPKVLLGFTIGEILPSSISFSFKIDVLAILALEVGEIC